MKTLNVTEDELWPVVYYRYRWSLDVYLGRGLLGMDSRTAGHTEYMWLGVRPQDGGRLDKMTRIFNTLAHSLDRLDEAHRGYDIKSLTPDSSCFSHIPDTTTRKKGGA